MSKKILQCKGSIYQCFAGSSRSHSVNRHAPTPTHRASNPYCSISPPMVIDSYKKKQLSLLFVQLVRPYMPACKAGTTAEKNESVEKATDDTQEIWTTHGESGNSIRQYKLISEAFTNL